MLYVISFEAKEFLDLFENMESRNQICTRQSTLTRIIVLSEVLSTFLTDRCLYIIGGIWRKEWNCHQPVCPTAVDWYGGP